MDSRRAFLQKFTGEIILANKRLQEEELKTKGYQQSLPIPNLQELHERAVLEAKNESAGQTEIEAIENEMYIKELEKRKIESREDEERNENNQDISASKSNSRFIQYPDPQIPELKRETLNNKEYEIERDYYSKKILENEFQDVENFNEREQHQQESFESLEQEALENETYEKHHPIEEEKPPEKMSFYSQQLPTQSGYPDIEQDKELLKAKKGKLVTEEHEENIPNNKEMVPDETIKETEEYPETKFLENQETYLYRSASPILKQPSDSNFQRSLANKQEIKTPSQSPFPIPPISQYEHAESTPPQMQQPIKKGGFIRPMSKEQSPNIKASLQKIRELISDHAITFINCPGPLKPIVAKRMGFPETLKIVLDDAGIHQVIKEFSDASRIPYSNGIFKAIVGDLMITALITSAVGSRFTITRIIPQK